MRRGINASWSFKRRGLSCNNPVLMWYSAIILYYTQLNKYQTSFRVISAVTMYAPQSTRDNKMATETNNKDLSNLKFVYQSNAVKHMALQSSFKNTFWVFYVTCPLKYLFLLQSWRLYDVIPLTEYQQSMHSGQKWISTRIYTQCVSEIGGHVNHDLNFLILHP